MSSSVTMPQIYMETKPIICHKLIGKYCHCSLTVRNITSTGLEKVKTAGVVQLQKAHLGAFIEVTLQLSEAVICSSKFFKFLFSCDARLVVHIHLWEVTMCCLVTHTKAYLIRYTVSQLCVCIFTLYSLVLEVVCRSDEDTVLLCSMTSKKTEVRSTNCCMWGSMDQLGVVFEIPCLCAWRSSAAWLKSVSCMLKDQPDRHLAM